jgi:putative glutathione S-transferase
MTSVEEDQTNKAARQADGEFVRGVSAYRTSIEAGIEVEEGRYHLYIAYNCPWCHRVALARSMLGLEGAISMDVLLPTRTEEDQTNKAARQADGEFVRGVSAYRRCLY